MKLKQIFNITLISCVVMLSSCDSRLDLVPKGESTLDNIEDISLLLNQEYSLGILPFSDLGLICNESLGCMLSVPEVLSSSNTLNYAYMTYNEDVDRVTLCQSEERYSAIYKYVNYMNTVIAKLEDVEGSDARKNELRAKSRVMRSYLHWLCVNIYARQYDEATASEDGGIPYVTDIDNMAVKRKLSLSETYRNILEDCTDEVISMLPDETTDIIQPDRAFGNAVRGKVLMQMKRYSEALSYLQKALELNGGIEDRSVLKETGEWILPRTVSNNYVWIGAGIRVSPTTEVISLETCAKFEKNDYAIRYLGSNGWDFGYGKMYSGIEGSRMFMGWSTCTNPYGITSDHLYYDVAECLIRTGRIRDGLVLVDKVRKNRVENASSYVKVYDIFPIDEHRAMALLQPAKWIECLGGYENFFDMKRWNSEEGYRQTISRSLGDYGTYTLSPDSPLWILPFPGNATRHNPTLTQNFGTKK